MLTFLGGLLLGVLGNEVFELTPWLAGRVLRLAARVDARTPDERALLFHEWAGQVDEVPGKLTKLLFALRLLCGVAIARHADRVWRSVLDGTPAALGSVLLICSIWLALKLRTQGPVWAFPVSMVSMLVVQIAGVALVLWSVVRRQPDTRDEPADYCDLAY